MSIEETDNVVIDIPNTPVNNEVLDVDNLAPPSETEEQVYDHATCIAKFPLLLDITCVNKQKLYGRKLMRNILELAKQNLHNQMTYHPANDHFDEDYDEQFENWYNCNLDNIKEYAVKEKDAERNA